MLPANFVANTPALATWAIAATATAGVVVRPWRTPEFVWALLGAAALVLSRLLGWRDALAAAGRGSDVYFFLIGMMLLAELARQEGLFDWLARLAARHAAGSAKRLFSLVYAVGVLVTTFLSNDATAVVLTPAVYAAARAANAEPLPFLLICAFIANAASFVLPISNPANLVMFHDNMPTLGVWLWRFTLPSIASIAATYVALRIALRRWLRRELVAELPEATLSAGARHAALGILATGLILLGASAVGVPLGIPTFLAGGVTAAVVLTAKRQAPWAILEQISWSVLPLVAGLFILVAGLQKTGVIDQLGEALRQLQGESETAAIWWASLLVAIADNLINNLPTGLIASAVGATVGAGPRVSGALLMSVDIGPNLSITGSLATILWLIALRREGAELSALRFLKLGIVVMPPALLSAVAASFLIKG